MKLITVFLVALVGFFAPVVPVLMLVGMAIFWRTGSEVWKIKRKRKTFACPLIKKALHRLVQRMALYQFGVLSFFAMDILILSKFGSVDFKATRFVAGALMLVEMYSIDKNVKEVTGSGLIALIGKLSGFAKEAKDAAKGVFTALLVLSVASGCLTANNAIRKHYRIIKLFPFVHTQDSIIVHDTLRMTISRAEKDTLFKDSITKDTVFITQNRLRIKYYRDGKKIYLKGECDSIRVEQIITRKQKVLYFEKPVRWWQKLTVIFGFCLAGFAIGFYLTNRK